MTLPRICNAAAASFLIFLVSVAAFAAGALDPSFGTGGRATFDFTPAPYVFERGVRIAVQPDGKLLASAETSSNSTVRVIFSRHLADGSLDATFGSGGKIVTDFGACAECFVSTPRFVLLSDGRIIVAAQEMTNAPAVSNIVVSRLTSSGTIDATFGNGGVARVNPDGNTSLGDMAVQPDGRIVLVGATGPSTLVAAPPSDFPLPPQPAPAHWLVARLDASGAPDATFTDSAASNPNAAAPSVAQRVAIQSDGHIVVAGKSPGGGLGGWRYAADGSGAMGFGTSGTGEVADLVVDHLDRIWMLMAGQDNFLVRFNPDIVGSTGYDLPIFPEGASFVSVLPLPSGEAYVAGGNFFRAAQWADYASGGMVVKLDTQGRIDNAFGDRGSLALDRFPLASLALQPDGRVVASGTYGNTLLENGGRLGLARVDPTGSAFVNTEWLYFPLQSLGTRRGAWLVTVTNMSGATRTVSATATANFEAVAGCNPLAPGESCYVYVYHHPTTTSAAFSFADYARGTVTISDDAGKSATVSLYATVEKSLVQHFYEQVLGRNPDGPGYQFWNAEARRIYFEVIGLSDGGTNTVEAWNAMAVTFFASPEYTDRNTDNTTYILNLYQTFFDRSADGPGLLFWQGQLAQGLPREMLLTAFLFSPEFTAFNATYFGGTANRPELDLVMDLYRGILGRLPDTGGLRYWAGRMQRAQCIGEAAVRAEVDALSSIFLNAPEYANRARTNPQHLADLYNAFLRRAGDAEGFGFWKSGLDEGDFTREEVRVAFMNSAEFAGRVQAVLQVGCRPQ